MGYLGMVGAEDPCAVQVNSIYAARPSGFRASPYGVSHDLAATLSLVPYLIDPVTLAIEWREDLIVGPVSNALGLAAVLDDSTMVWHEVGPPSGGSYTSRLRVLRRSGITIALSGEQQSVATSLPTATVMRVDSSHVLRAYVQPTTLTTVVEVLSVAGSTISLVSSTSYVTGSKIVTRDGGEAGTPTVTIGSLITPFHYDGSGTLYCFGTAAAFPGFQRIHAVPFSIGGSIAAPGLSWRSRDAQNITFFMPTAKIGSSECLLQQGSSEVGFYDDGSQMHYAAPGIDASGYAASEQDHESSFGDYLVAHVLEAPAGSPVPGQPTALISQSGTTLSYTPISVIVRCPTGLDIAGSAGPTRHDVALGATSDALGGGLYLLWAFRW